MKPPNYRFVDPEKHAPLDFQLQANKVRTHQASLISGFQFLPAEVILTGICGMTDCYLSRDKQILSTINKFKGQKENRIAFKIRE